MMKIVSPMVVIMVAVTAVSHAATETWDGGHSSANAWYANLNWLDDTAPVDGDSLVFTGTTRLNHYSWGGWSGNSDAQIAGITFDAAAGAFVISDGGGGTYRLQGNITNNSGNLQTINFPLQIDSGNRTIDAASGNISIGGVISQDSARSLTKAGDGTLVLSAANTYSGGTTIGTSVDGGTIEIHDNSALGSGGVTFSKGGTLALGANGLDISNWIGFYNWGGTDPRQITLDLAGSNSGTLSGSTMEVRTSGQSVFEVGTDDTLTVSRNLVNTHGSFIDSGIRKTGDGTLVLTGANTFKGNTRVLAGRLDLGDGGADGSLRTTANNDIVISSNATFAVNQSDTVTQGTDFSGDPITGDGNFVQAGSGTTVLTAANTYTGTTDVADGTLVLSGSGTISESSAITVGNTATLRFSRNDTWGNAATDTSAPITLNAGSTMESGGYFNTVRDLTLNGGDVDLTGGANATYPALALKGTVTVVGSQTSAINVISGNYNMISVGDDTLGATVFDVSDVATDADLTIGAPLQNNVMGSGDITKSGAGSLALTGANTYSGDTTISAGWLELGDGGTSGSLSTSSTITNDGVFVVNQSDTVTQGTDFSGDPITGSGAVMQGESSGRLVLNTANTYSGGTRFGRNPGAWGGQLSTLEGGTIEILDSGAISTGGVTFEKGGTLELGVSGLSLANSFFLGNWSGNAHTIRLDEDGSATGALSGNVQIHDGTGSGFQVDVGTDDALTMSGAFFRTAGGGAGITKIGDGTLILTGDSQNFGSGTPYVGDAKVNVGTLQLGDGGAAGTMATGENISIASGATFAVNQSDTVTQGTDFSASAISGDGGFKQMGSGKTVLNVANTYAGDTTISAGTLALSGSGTLGSGSYAGNISNSGTFKYNSPEDQALSGTISGAGTLSMVHDSSTLTLSGAGNTIGTLNAAGGNLVLSGSSDTTVSGHMKVGNSAAEDGGSGTLTVQDSAALTVNGAFYVGNENSTDGTVSQSGGTVNLDGSSVRIAHWSNLTGTYTMSDGTLNVTNTDLFVGWDGQGYLNVDGGTANVKGIGYGWNNNAARAGTLTLGGGTVNVGSGGMYEDGGLKGTINLNSGTLGALAGWSSSMDMTLGGSVDIDTTGGDIALSGALSGGGGFAKVGSGSLTLSGANTYAGNTTVSNGTLKLSGGSAIPDGAGKGDVIVASGGTLDPDGANETINGLSGSGTVDNTAGGGCVLIVCSNDVTSTFAGTIQDTGGSLRLDKVGTGTLTLTAANSYQGGTKLGHSNGSSAGTVSIEDSAALGTGSFEFEAGGTLDLGVDGLSVGNTVRVLYRNDTAARTIRLDQAGSTVGELSGTVDLRWNGSNGFVLDVGEADTLTVSGTIVNQAGGGCGVTKTGAGTAVLTGANTYSVAPGGTTINGGTLLVNNTSGSGTGTRAVRVNSSGTLGGTGSMSGVVTVNSGGHVAPGTSIGTITMAGGLTLNDGAELDYEVDTAGVSGDKIMVGGGTFTGATSGDGVTVNVTLSGTPSGDETYTLIDWSSASASGVELDDFDLVCNTVGGYRGTLQIVGSELQLSVATIPGTIFRFR